MNSCMVVCPDSVKSDGNHLACAVGKSMDDLLTFDKAPRATKGAGQYRWCNAQVSETFFDKLTQPVTRPAYDTESQIDLQAAQDALDGALVLTPSMMLESPPDVSARLLICPNLEPQAVLLWLGLVAE